jgi:conjugative transfer signal peptidase TraF
MTLHPPPLSLPAATKAKAIPAALAGLAALATLAAWAAWAAWAALAAWAAWAVATLPAAPGAGTGGEVFRFAGGLGDLRYNTSGSLPRGLYRLTDAPPRPFDLVLVCPPAAAAALARERGYLRRGRCPGGVRPLGKLLLAGPGDEVEVSAAGLSLAGRRAPASQALATDAAGRPLPAIPRGLYPLARGAAWVYAPHPRSFDSRYFGPVSATALRGTLTPLWVTRTTAADRTLLDMLARRRLPP